MAARLTAEQARAIAECVAAGERHTEIAERFGVSVETVGAIKSGKRHASAIDDGLRGRMQAAVPTAVLTEADARAVMAALEAGRAGVEIAAEFGVSPSLVSAIKHGRAWADIDPDFAARIGGAQRQGKALDAEQVAEIKRRLAADESTRSIAAQVGVSASTIRAIAHGRTWAGVEPEQ